MERVSGIEDVESPVTQSTIVLGNNLHVLGYPHAWSVVRTTRGSVGQNCIVAIVGDNILTIGVNGGIKLLNEDILNLPLDKLLPTSKVSSLPLINILQNCHPNTASTTNNPLGLYLVHPLLKILLVASTNLPCSLLLLGQMIITWPQYSHPKATGGTQMLQVPRQIHHMGCILSKSFPN